MAQARPLGKLGKVLAQSMQLAAPLGLRSGAQIRDYELVFETRPNAGKAKNLKVNIKEKQTEIVVLLIPFNLST